MRVKQTHTPRNLSVALLLSGGIRRFIYASAFPYSQLHIAKADSIAYVDPVTLPMLFTESLDAMSAGGEYTRVQKTMRVAELPDSYTSLDVCVKSIQADNCSACGKCLRTLLTLEIAGVLDRYASVFNLNVYHQHRDSYLAHVRCSRGSYEREIIAFARERGFSLKPKLKSLTRLYTLKLRNRSRRKFSLK